MEAPKCKICQKRHYGLCHGVVTPIGEEPAVVKAARGVEEPAGRYDDPGLIDARSPEAKVEERLVALEQIIDELLAGKRKRSVYMKQYMRDRRAKG